jgi:predicted lipid-binding transport protein (Tim44 family)
MKNSIRWTISLILVMLFAGVAILAHDADARAGGGRSFGSSGSRGYSMPSSPYSGSGASRQGTSPSPAQPAGGGFLRSMGGGLLGGLLGGMLFSSLFGGSGGGFGGGGIGILEIILLGGGGYLLFTMIKRRKDAAPAYQSSYQEGSSFTGSGDQPQMATVEEGIMQIRRMDPSFDERLFKDTVMDIFFAIQGAWTNRNLSTGNGLLTDEMKGIFQEDIDKLIQEKKVNRLENIAVRKVEVVEAWQEAGQDFVKTLFTANLLDYTTDDSTGDVVAGSKTTPVKFEECWTFTRSVGNNPWKLSAISQVKTDVHAHGERVG